MTDSLENIITEELTKSFTVVERFPERKYLLDEYSDRNDLSLEEALFTKNVVLWECSSCGISFAQSVISRLRLPIRIKCQHVSAREINSETILKTPLLSEAEQDILKDFDYNLNAPLKPDDFTLKSQTKIWWSFQDCGHKRYMQIGNRTVKKQGCGEGSCKNKKSVNSRFTNLSFDQSISEDSRLSNMWSHNNEYKPTNVSRLSNKSWLWICECGEEWESRPPKKDYTYFACSECSPDLSRLMIVKNRVDRAGGPLWKTHPDIWSEVDLQRNEEAGINADLIYYGIESKKVWWNCDDCKQSYSMSHSRKLRGGECSSESCINMRIGDNARNRAWDRLGPMSEAHPELLDEFDYEKNLKSPSEIRANSKEDVWWICQDYSHSWEQSIYSRIRYQNNCIICSKGSPISKLEYEVFEAILAKMPGLKCIRNNRSLAQSDGYKFELDLYFPEHSKGIEVNGNYWHSDERIRSRAQGNWHNAEQYHSSKLNSFSDVGIDIVFLWEYEWVMIREEILDELITFLKTGKKSKKLLTLKHSETSCYKPVSKP